MEIRRQQIVIRDAKLFRRIGRVFQGMDGVLKH